MEDSVANNYLGMTYGRWDIDRLFSTLCPKEIFAPLTQRRLISLTIQQIRLLSRLRSLDKSLDRLYQLGNIRRFDEISLCSCSHCLLAV